MCGIVGKIIFQGKEINQNKEIPFIEESSKKLYHRGPDDQGFILDENVWLGATRLSILDLTDAGHQPMKNKDGSICLVFNGEIYNFLEIKEKLKNRHRFISNTDTEVLLHLYEDEGINCLKYLRGMFAFAIWDKRKKELFIARDRIGKKPLKYYFDDKFFIFASELKAFINHPGVPKEVDWDAIDEFLTYQYVPAPKTGFKNIWKLPPAHYMIVRSNGEIITRKYWDLNFSKKLDLKEREWEELVLDKLKESVKLRLQSDVPLGVHLSGGIDSSLITAIASSLSKKPVKTFSIGFEESEYSELPYAQLVANRYNTDHHTLIVKSDVIDLLPQLIHQYEEPFADPSILPTWYLMEETKKYVTVALNGDGGDENFAGYRRYIAMKLFSFLRFFPYRDRLSDIFTYLYTSTHIRNFSSISKLLAISYSDYRSYYQDLISFIPSTLRDALYTEEFKEKISKSRSKKFLAEKISSLKDLNLVDQLLSVDINTFLPEVLLTKADISSMAHSVESRSPFLDHTFMELTAKIPSDLKLRYFQDKYILKKIAEKFIPSECFERRKQGFIPPLEMWFREELAEYIKIQLMDKQFLSLNLFNNEVLLEIIGEHQAWKRNNAYILWTLLCLKNWLHEWFHI